MTKAELYQRVDKTRSRHNITMTSDVMYVDRLCRGQFGLHVDYVEFTTPGLRGMAVLPKNQIVLSANMRPEQKKYYCTHEFVHFVFHDDCDGHTFSCYETSPSETDDFREWEANEAAAELLIPRRTFLPIVIHAAPHVNTRKDYIRLRRELTASFGVTEQMIRVRFWHMRYEIFQLLSGVQFSDLRYLSDRKQVESGISIPTLDEIYLDRFVHFPMCDVDRWKEATFANEAKYANKNALKALVRDKDSRLIDLGLYH